MQRNLLTILTLSIFLISSISVTSGEIIEDSESIIDITENNSFIKSKLESKRLPEQSPDIFTANLGQLDNDKVLFYTQNGMIWFTDDGVWMELREYGLRGQGSEASGQGDYNPMQKFEPPEQVLYNSLIIKQEFIGANKVIPEGRNQLEFYYNYFYGNDPSKWRANVPNFHEIYYENLYNGIDLRYYFNEHGLKYDFIVHPGADLSQIRIKYEGAQKLEITQSGELRIKTQLMDLIDGKLCIYQEDLLSRNIIKGKFVKLDDLEYSFELLGKYDPQKILVIDPLISLDFSTYVGGMDYNYATSVATYSAGYPYATGYTRSTDFPKTSGSYQPNNKGGYDAYILKFNLFGSTLLFGTFLGGTLNDYATDIVVDSSGNPIITGYTRSQNFPNTTGAYDPDYNSRYDAFVAKFNPSGNLLLYSTYLGGDEDEYAYGIAVDSNGNAYVTGSTKSSDYPTTSNAYDRFFYTDWEQVFISKLNNAGTNLLYSTFIAGYQFDCAYDIAVDSNNNMYVTGVTESWRYPTTDGAYDETHSGALERDMFVTKIHSGGSTLLYSTFVKGSSDDMGYDIALDSQNNAVVTGTSWSSDFPTTPGVVDNHNNYDGVIFKLNHNGSKLIFSTFLGGNDGESVNDVTLDSMDNVYLTGFTNSQDFPITPDAHDPIYALKQAFFTILSPNATNFLYSTYIGGTGEEVGYGIAISPNGEVYIVGETRSNNFYTSASAFDSTYGGTRDGFLQKYTISSEIKVKSIQLIKTHPTLGIIYSRLKPYTFEANITDTVSHFDLKYVKLILDPSGSDIQILWNRTSNNFSEINDPYDYVSLAPSMAVYHDLYYWSIDFNLTFNWTYPDENVNSVQVIAYSSILQPVNKSATGLYNLENDLEFSGSLFIRDEDDQLISEDQVIRGGEKLTWSGLIPIYEGSTDLCPPDEEFNISIIDEDGNSWIGSPETGQTFYIETKSPKKTTPNGFNYTIKLSGIPANCDLTNQKFRVFLDAEKVVFSNMTPPVQTWQTSSDVVVGVTITDIGGASVDGSSVRYRISTNKSIEWGDWTPVSGLNSDQSINVNEIISFKNGKSNLIKWRATDSVGNDPEISQTHRIWVDTGEVVFSEEWPLDSEISDSKNVEFGITISDENSGVNASSIRYSISEDDGKTWNPWIPIAGYRNGSKIKVKISHIFPNGTENRIKFKASDLAGNGPTHSFECFINVNVWLNPSRPEVKLLSLPNEALVNESSVELSWKLEEHFDGIAYDLYFENKNPPKLYKEGIETENYSLYNLTNDVYYWKVIPRLDELRGKCISGIWWFKVEIDDPTIYDRYKINIIGADEIKLHIGDEKNVLLTITNLGEGEDTVKLELDRGLLENYIKFDDDSDLVISQNSVRDKYLSIILPDSAQVGTYEVIITAISLGSGEKVFDTHTLTINIKEKNEPPVNTTKPKRTTQFRYDLVVGLIIIIIVIIILIWMFIKRKEKDKQPPEPTSMKILTQPTQPTNYPTQQQLPPYPPPGITQIPMAQPLGIYQNQGITPMIEQAPIPTYQPTSDPPVTQESTQIQQSLEDDGTEN